MIPDLRVGIAARNTCRTQALLTSIARSRGLPHWIRVISTVNTRVIDKRHGTSRGLRMIDSMLVVKFLRMSGRFGVISSAVVSMMACGSARPVPVAPTTTTAAPPRPQVKLAVIPAESDAFPRAANAVSESLTSAQVGGVDKTSVSKVSLEVVQLSIERVDPTDTC